MLGHAEKLKTMAGSDLHIRDNILAISGNAPLCQREWSKDQIWAPVRIYRICGYRSV